jgi:hypothetical protein
MRFAKIVFITAGVWGIVVLLALDFLVDMTGGRYAPTTAYPQYFYGFLVVALAWQVGFLVVGSNPERFRPLMLPCTIEKLGYVATLVILRSQDRISNADAAAVVPDLVLGLLFIAAFAKTRKRPDAVFQSPSWHAFSSKYRTTNSAGSPEAPDLTLTDDSDYKKAISRSLRGGY